MSAYTCIKPATFAGNRYMPGDIIPAGAIPADRVDAVIRLGLIAETAAPAPAGADGLSESFAEVKPVLVAVPVIQEDGTVQQLDITGDGVAIAVATMQMNAESAVEQIAAIADISTLVMIGACDTRKTVKKAAAARIDELVKAEKQEQQEPPTGDHQEGAE